MQDKGETRIETLQSPGELFGGETGGIGWGYRRYHPGAGAGHVTDYGLGNVMLLEYCAAAYTSSGKPKFNLEDYTRGHWRQQYEGWQQGQCRACGNWLDTMTRTALQNIDQGVDPIRAGGHSNAMVLRWAPLLGVLDDEEALVHAARELTIFTNRNQEPVDASEFWARASWRVLHEGLTPLEAIQEAVRVVGEHSPFIQEKVSQGLAKAKEAQDPTRPLSQQPAHLVDDIALTSMARLWDVGKSEPIKVGKASPTEGTLPGAVYFLAKYGSDFHAAASANALVGGDNASRSIPIGLMLGLHLGLEGLPGGLVDQLKDDYAKDRLVGLVNKLPLVRSGGGGPGGEEL